jgi:hypothetical protein
MTVSKNCFTCGAPLETIRESCRYCGGKEANPRSLGKEDENRIFWLLNILNARLFRESYRVQYLEIRKWLAINFIVGLTGFLLTFYLSEKYLLAFLLNCCIVINPLLGCFKSFSNYLVRISEHELFEKDLKLILSDFMEGYHYLPSDIESVLSNHTNLYFIQRILIQKKSQEKGSSALMSVANNLLDFFEEDCYAESLKKTSYFFQSSGIIILLGYSLFCSISFFMIQNFRGFMHEFILILGFIFTCWLIMEQMDITKIIFHSLGYNPNLERMKIKWDLVLDYLKKSERTIEEFKTILQNDSKFVRLNSYLSENKYTIVK